MHSDSTRPVHARIPTPEGEFQLCHYPSIEDGKEHLALVYGDVNGVADVLVRVHSECFTGDVLGSLRCDCGPQLQMAMDMIAQSGRGVIVYLRQEGRGIGLAEKLRAYNLQDQGYDTVEANLMLGHQADERGYQPAAAILNDLGISSIQLLTNNPEKIEGLTALGITISQRISLETCINAENSGYLQTKVTRMRHMLKLTNGHTPPPANNSSTDHRSTGCHSNHRVTHNKFAESSFTESSFTESGFTESGFTESSLAATGLTTTGLTTTGLTDSRFTDNGLIISPTVDAQVQMLRQQIARHQHPERPFITASYAQSLDGSITAARGQTLAISGPESMKVTHAIRAAHDAILVGINTILADDPRLNVRLVPGKSPIPVVLDSHLRIPTSAQLFDTHPSVIIATTQPANGSSLENPNLMQKIDDLQHRGATLLHLSADKNNRVCISSLLNSLRRHNIHSIMVEGGSTVLSSFLTSSHVDYLAVTIAPLFVGGLNVVDLDAAIDIAPLMSGQSTPASQSVPAGQQTPAGQLPRLLDPVWTPVGSDLILWGQPTGKH